ncbi:uncharacterized protein STEHIDRAFT_112905 [Stereum hirsutum FP-91666 SS1]|uniref:uncharacterized protein n=1 Tax=Stereum hirsutum (strain FP-91666) TaxID=721885 RepID=UPI000444A6EB|nr:uncharacterized protein STEHIDRAFT_112905 [Stereum hirsutum FP-91666 SS1]EIM84563.1 hypothetical protein STEHIDRAFT_112905 [Stereum hirsutum FP-91666 SS1]
MKTAISNEWDTLLTIEDASDEDELDKRSVSTLHWSPSPQPRSPSPPLVVSSHHPVETRTEVEWKRIEAEKRKQARQGRYDPKYVEKRGRVFFSNDGTLYFSPNCRKLPRWQPPHRDFDPKTLRELQLPVWYKRPEVVWKSCVMINMPFNGVFACLRDQYCRQLEFNSSRNVWRLSPHVQQLWSVALDAIEKCLWSIRDGSLGMASLMELPPRPDHLFRQEFRLRGAANSGIVEARNRMIAWISAFFFFVRCCDRVVPLASDDPLSEPSAHLAKSYPSLFTWLPKWFRILVRAHPELQGWLSSVRTYWSNVDKENIPGLFFDFDHYGTAAPPLSWLYENGIPVWYPWREKEMQLAATDPLIARFKPPESILEEAEDERYEEEHARWEAGLEAEVETRQRYDRDLSRQRREQEGRSVSHRTRARIMRPSRSLMSAGTTQRPPISFAPITSHSLSSTQFATPVAPHESHDRLSNSRTFESYFIADAFSEAPPMPTLAMPSSLSPSSSSPLARPPSPSHPLNNSSSFPLVQTPATPSPHLHLPVPSPASPPNASTLLPNPSVASHTASSPPSVTCFSPPLARLPSPPLPSDDSSNFPLTKTPATPSSHSHLPVLSLASPPNASTLLHDSSVTSHTSSNSHSVISASTHTSDMYQCQVPARPYGQDLVAFFHRHSAENAIIESHEAPEERDCRIRRDKINGSVRIYEWAEELAVQGSFMVLSMSERKYTDVHARMEGARELLANTALSHLYDSHRNELHFVSAIDTFCPPKIQKYRQLHPEFIDEEEERTFSPEIDASTGTRSITFEDDAVAVATIRFGFNPRSVESVESKVDREMWKIVLSKLQSMAPSLDTVSSSLAQGIWEFLESFAKEPTHNVSKHPTETQSSFAARVVPSSTADTPMSTIPLGSGLRAVIRDLVYIHQSPHATTGPDAGPRVGGKHNVDHEATSPLSKMWTIDSPTLVMVGRGRAMEASHQPSALTSMTTCSDQWCLVVTSACDALHASRLLAGGLDTTDVALHLCERAIPFRTVVWRGPMEPEHRPKPKPVRFDGHVWNSWDYREYLRERSDLLRIPWIRRACYLAGGILWRIANEVCGPPSREMIEKGPSEGARRGEHASNIRGWVDDELSEDIMALMIGLYLCPQYPSQEVDELRELASGQEQGRANLKRLSWWPLPSTFWHYSLGSLGHWSPRNEQWYTDRRRDLELCYLADQVSSNPVPPKGAKQWRNTTKFGGFSRRLLTITEDNAGSMIRSDGKSLEESGLPYIS